METNIGRLIVFEGVDGAGKTETGRLLEKDYCFKYCATPPNGYKPIRSYMNETASPISRFLYYMAGNIDASHEIKNLLKADNVICDRYVFSTLVAHSIRENMPLEKMIELSKPYQDYLVVPDVTILLDVEPDEQIRRLNRRNKGNNSSSDRIILDNGNLRQKFRETYFEAAVRFGWPVIDTTGKSVRETVQCLVKISGISSILKGISKTVLFYDELREVSSFFEKRNNQGAP